MSTRKVWVVASTEFGTAIRTKAFLIGLLLMPVLIAVSMGLQVFARKADTRPRSFAVIDRAGWLYPAIEAAAKVRNNELAQRGASAPRFLPSREQGAAGEEQLLALSDRVRKGALFAFVEIPPDIARPSGEPAIRYHSENPNDDRLLDWLEGVVNDQVRSRRFRDAGIDRALADRLSRPVEVENLGLLSRAIGPSPGQAGAIRAAEKIDKVRTVGVPAVLMFVLFIVVMATAPQLLNSVLEEKMSKISEVLLGSVSPFELMMGKLLGNLGIAIVLAAVYVGGGFGVAAYYGYADALTPGIFAAFCLFLLLAILINGSLSLAVGSACSEIKDAQSLMMPVMVVATFPIYMWFAVAQNPSSPLSVGLSLFPLATPYLMLMRMCLTPAPPAWQVALSIVLTTLTSIACVWAAAKIFRTGLLMQGKAPTFRDLARWVMAR
jgi:ABC-2 type transport system permease protein